MASFNNIKASRFDTVKDQYTLNEFKQWFKEVSKMTLPKVFSDSLDTAKVARLHDELSSSDLASVYQYLLTTQVMKRSNPHDISTAIPSSVTSYKVGGTVATHEKASALIAEKKSAPEFAVAMSVNKPVIQYTIAKEDDEKDEKKVELIEKSVTHGVITEKPDTIGVIARLLGSSTKQLNEIEEEKSTIVSKDIPVSSQNPFSPQLFAKSVAHAVNASRAPHEEYKHQIAQQIFREKAVATVATQLLAAAPIIGKKKLIYTEIQNGKQVMKCNTIAPPVFSTKSEFVAARALYDIYASGTHTYMVKERLNSYLGIPGSENYEHIVSLYDAGVVPGSVVLVLTTNSMLVEVLKATFGPNIYGLNSGYVTLATMARYKYDYVYFPDYIPFQHMGSIESSTQSWFASITRMCSGRFELEGKWIIKTSPMALFSSSIYSFLMEKRYIPPMEIEYVASNKIEKRNKAPSEYKVYTSYEGSWEMAKKEGASGNRPRQVIAKEDEHQWVASDRTDASAYGKAFVMPSLVMGESHVKAVVSMCSTIGHMLYCDGLPAKSFYDVYGEVVGIMSHSMAYLWCGTPWTYNTYEISRIRKKADTLYSIYDDKYSAFCGSVLLEEIMSQRLEAPLERVVDKAGPPLIENVEFAIDDNLYEG